jgi:hypothetical protein
MNDQVTFFTLIWNDWFCDIVIYYIIYVSYGRGEQLDCHGSVHKENHYGGGEEQFMNAKTN